ncbi:MAG: DUF4346 domain-containing protein [Nanoarchaeota archaeon]
MSEQWRIKLDRGKCIGAGMCVTESPDNFKIIENKAELINSETHNDISHLDIIPNEAEKEKMIIAAKSCPVNAIGIINLTTNKEIVSMNLSSSNKLKQITAHYNDLKEWRMDPLGYFLIRIDSKNKIIEAGHCIERNIVDTIITGKSSTEIFNTIIREKLVGSLQHAAYLGKELHNAEIALKKGLKYVQDEPVKI